MNKAISSLFLAAFITADLEISFGVYRICLEQFSETSAKMEKVGSLTLKAGAPGLPYQLQKPPFSAPPPLSTCGEVAVMNNSQVFVRFSLMISRTWDKKWLAGFPAEQDRKTHHKTETEPGERAQGRAQEKRLKWNRRECWKGRGRLQGEKRSKGKMNRLQAESSWSWTAWCVGQYISTNACGNAFLFNSKLLSSVRKDVRFSVSSAAGLQCFCMDTKGYHEAEKKVESFYRGGKRKQCLDTIGKSVLRMLLVAYGSVLWIAGSFDGIVAKQWFEIKWLAHFMFQYSIIYLKKLSDQMAWAIGKWVFLHGSCKIHLYWRQ